MALGKTVVVPKSVKEAKLLHHLKKIVSDMNEKIKTDVNYNQEIVILKGIILSITKEFLFNEKYGLNTFLSSRIRHGYCKSQLTTLFHDFNLMSKALSDSSEAFTSNEYWDSKLSYGDKSLIFKRNLSDFTYEIEMKVKEVKDEWLKIRFYEGETGQFDYVKIVNNMLLVIDQADVMGFDLFFKSIIDMLWKRTEIILEEGYLSLLYQSSQKFLYLC